ncbi:MAG: hypothetical protein A4E28_01156 [Methanocella sp. PtaU1.Bin125]|nr:MAG: hypothetical protein A4E28_01156 [Methanocella sp. PtaU1.Bin125]
MSLEEFRQYWKKYRNRIRSARAFDSAGRRWVEGDEILRAHGAYTLIVVQFKDRTFLRISVKPSLKVSYAPEKYASAGTWSRLGIFLTFEEKEFLNSIGNDALSPDELIDAVNASGFQGRAALADKLKKAADRMRR